MARETTCAYHTGFWHGIGAGAAGIMIVCIVAVVVAMLLVSLWTAL